MIPGCPPPRIMARNEATFEVLDPAPAYRVKSASSTPQLGHTRSAKVVVKTGPTVALRAIPELEKPYVTTDPSAATTAISIRSNAVSSADRTTARSSPPPFLSLLRSSCVLPLLLDGARLGTHWHL